MLEFTFTSTVIRWQGKSAWHFIPLPSELSEDIDNWYGDMKGGWGSLPVTVRIGKTSWTTSIFPDKKRGTYLLPLKAQVRKAESITAGDEVEVALDV